MQDVRSSTVIEASPERVFDHLNDWERLSSYTPWFSVTPDEPDGRPELGTSCQAELVLPTGVVKLTERAEVSDHYYPERLRIGVGLYASVAWTFGRTGDRTLLEARVAFELPLGAASRIVGNASSLLLKRDLDAAVDRLKRDVESG